jgi:DNA-binding NtrC family response regulator
MPGLVPVAAQAPESRELKKVISDIQNEQIKEAILACGGNKKKAAAILGISRSFLYKKLAAIEGTGQS